MVTSIDTPHGLTSADAVIKRMFDLIFSFIGLIITGPIIAVAWVLAALNTGRNGFFLQSRVGRFGKSFKIIKIRTMRTDSVLNTTVTTSTDRRITRVGRILRKTKIDELPQLINVLMGDMSFVGPRPDVAGFADILEGDDRVVLSVRPGITGPAALAYRNEEEILSLQEDPELYNREVIFPEKVRINREYIEKYSFLNDIKYIFLTLFHG